MITTIQPPKDVADNKLYRALLLQWADTDERREQIISRCREDIIWWINSFGWQFNPDCRGKEVDPFICYDFQAEVIVRTMKRLLEYRMPVVWEKGRKLGASWMMLFIEAHQCAFLNRQKFLNLSHSEDAVNQPDDPDALFWKIRFIVDMLPEWMVDVRPLKRSFKFRNTRSFITASATTDRAGVGGRGTVMADEFSKHPKAYQILGQTMDTGPQLFVGTHYGNAGAFFDLTRRPDMAKEVMHWTDHPDRVKGLYRSAPELAQGYEILDEDFEYGNQCSVCSRLVDTPVGEMTDCCNNEGKNRVSGVSRPYKFITDGKPTGGHKPGYRSPYYDFECVKRGNERDVAMHIDINPDGSQSEYFSAITLRKYVTLYCKPPVWVGRLQYDAESGLPIKLVEDDTGPIKLWVPPKSDTELPFGTYGVGCDISNGLGNTPSVMQAGDARNCHKILEFATADLYPEKFAMYVHALCWMLKDLDGTPALLCWEANGPGLIFGKEVMGLGYKRVYMRSLDQFFKGKAVSEKAGWHHNTNSLRLLMDSYKAALYGFDLANRSQQAIEECAQYRYAKNKDTIENSKAVQGENPEEARSNHGDRAMADAIMWMVMQQLGAGRALASRKAEEAAPRGSILWRRQDRERREKAEERWAG